ncbi:hypothetical protein GEMRC1_003779 [Eukaryota sp. GEM-RC1]
MVSTGDSQFGRCCIEISVFPPLKMTIPASAEISTLTVCYNDWKETFQCSHLQPEIFRYFFGESHPLPCPLIRTVEGVLLNKDSPLTDVECRLYDFSQDFSIESFLFYKNPSLASKPIIDLFKAEGFDSLESFATLTPETLQSFNHALSSKSLQISEEQCVSLLHAASKRRHFVLHPFRATADEIPLTLGQKHERSWVINSKISLSDKASLIPSRLVEPKETSLSSLESLVHCIYQHFGHHVCKVTHIEGRGVEHEIHSGTNIANIPNGSHLRVFLKPLTEQREFIDYNEEQLVGLGPEDLPALAETLSNGGELTQKCIMRVLDHARKSLSALPNVVEAELPKDCKVVLVGDIHGQFYDLLQILQINGYPADDVAYVFNGDWVDRGRYSVEAVMLILLMFLKCPGRVYLNRGNHETRWCTADYGFSKELKDKYESSHRFLYNSFHTAFAYLPIATVVNRSAFVVHGGLPKNGSTLSINDINQENRVLELFPRDSLIESLLWSDPSAAAGVHPSYRGFGYEFGGDVTRSFLETNKLKVFIRSHEMVAQGWLSHHQDRLYTVFSCPNYQEQNNMGAVLVARIGSDGDLNPNELEPITFNRAIETFKRPQYFALGKCCIC